MDFYKSWFHFVNLWQIDHQIFDCTQYTKVNGKYSFSLHVTYPTNEHKLWERGLLNSTLFSPLGPSRTGGGRLLRFVHVSSSRGSRDSAQIQYYMSQVFDYIELDWRGHNFCLQNSRMPMGRIGISSLASSLRGFAPNKLLILLTARIQNKCACRSTVMN